MNTIIDHRTNKHDIRPLRVRRRHSPEHLRVCLRLSYRSLLITTLLSVIFKSVNGTLSQKTGKSVWKYLSDGRDRRKIKEQKYPENVTKIN